jgi:hypothetical protein
VQTQEFNEDLFTRLHAKTGLATEEIAELFSLIAQIRGQATINEAQLLQLNRKIEKFTIGQPVRKAVRREEAPEN